MASDIVERLRQRMDEDEGRHGFWDPVVNDAANEILELRARAEKAEARLAAVVDVLDRWHAYWTERGTFGAAKKAVLGLLREIRAAALDGEGGVSQGVASECPDQAESRPYSSEGGAVARRLLEERNAERARADRAEARLAELRERVRRALAGDKGGA